MQVFQLAFRGTRACASVNGNRGRLAPILRRTYASETNPGKPYGNAPLYLSAAGAAGMGYYLYITLQDDGKKVSTVAAPALTSALSKDEFRDFELKKKEDYNHNTAKFTFKLPNGTATLLPTAGLVLVKPVDGGPTDDKGGPIVRPYTPISPSDLPGEVVFLIKKYDTGKLTPHIFDLKAGDKLSIKGPMPKIPYKPNEFDQIAMIAGGSGITPMYQVVSHALKQKDDKTKFKLIFANVSPSDILLREEWDALKQQNPERLDLVFVVDKADETWKGPTGHVTSELIKEHVKPASENVKIFICGPPGQVNAIAGKKDGFKQGALGGTLKALGYTEEQVFKF